MPPAEYEPLTNPRCQLETILRVLIDGSAADNQRLAQAEQDSSLHPDVKRLIQECKQMIGTKSGLMRAIKIIDHPDKRAR